MFSSTSPFSSLTCGGIHSEKKKRQKSQFLFTAQLLRKTNLAEIFSEARSGTIAHKNKKRITAVTQCFSPDGKQESICFLTQEKSVFSCESKNNFND
jgi:hypothetical protein